MEKFIKYINTQNKEQLKAELKELYSSFEFVRNFYTIKLEKSGINQKLLSKYQDQITKAIYPNKYMQGGLDIEKVDTIVKQLNSDSTLEYYIEVCLHAVEECTHIANELGGDFGEDFFIYFEELFEHVVQLICHENLASAYKIRLQEVAGSAFDGYGHHDQLQETYFDYIRS